MEFLPGDTKNKLPTLALIVFKWKSLFEVQMKVLNLV